MSTIQVNAIDLYYELCGQGEPLLLIHGLGSSSRDWEKQVDDFAGRYQVITFDVRGHGCSSKPVGPYSIKLFAEDTAALLKQLDILPAHVVGISMGGMIAFELALDFPNLVKSLTIVNSYPEVRVENFQDRLTVWRRFLLLEVFGMRGMGAALSKVLFIKPEQEDLRKTFVEHWAENDKRAYRESLRAIVGWDVEDRLGEIRCPTLIVASDEDYMPLEEKRAYAAKIPDARLVVIQDARHAVTAEKPEQFNAALEAFLVGLR